MSLQSTPHTLVLKLRIKVECAFGMLAHQWGMLQRALPASIGLRKTSALAMALCRLHNFCTDCRLSREGTAQASQSSGRIKSDVPKQTAGDALEALANGAVDTPDQLLDAGHHNDDTASSHHHQFSRRGLARNEGRPRASRACVCWRMPTSNTSSLVGKIDVENKINKWI